MVGISAGTLAAKEVFELPLDVTLRTAVVAPASLRALVSPEF
jgi:hypothetical protein